MLPLAYRVAIGARLRFLIAPFRLLLIMRIDSHQHFWRYNPGEYAWISPEMATLQRDFLPKDLEPALASVGFDGSVAVQARQSLEETRWLLELASQHKLIRAVVGWVDLCSPDLPSQLKSFAQHPKLTGVRHVVQDEGDDEFMLRPEFQRGIAQLREFNLTYDLLLYPKHLPIAVKLVDAFPDQPFVLDHIAKPRIADRLLSPWSEQITTLGSFPNVYCKLSGMLTEAKWRRWQSDDFRPYLDTAFEAFGVNRLMIGSDWPVSLLSGEYGQAMHVVIDYLRDLPAKGQAGVLGENCARFYSIEQRD
jgi:L-fuconolactonase